MAKIFDKMFINVLILGFSFMFVFTAFQTCGMIQHVVITSMQQQYPDYHGDGYVSLALLYGTFGVSNWMTPYIIGTIGPKISMLLGGLAYSLFISNFFFHETWILYLASAIIGIGASLIWTGQGNFLTINSDAETMSRNSGVFWALLQCSLIFGNIFFYFRLQGQETIDESTRFSVFGVLLGIALAGLALLCCLRTGKQESVNLSSEPGERVSEETEGLLSATSDKPGVWSELVKAGTLLKTKNMILLAMTFMYTGFELTFFSGVYGTSVGNTLRFGADSVKYIGISGICIGLGEIIGGAVFGILGKNTNKHGRDPIVLVGFLTHMCSFYLAYINLPAISVLEKTTDFAYIKSNVGVAMLCAFGLGLGDACYNTQIYSILGSSYSEDSSPAFALFKFFQSIAAAIAFVYSIYLDLHYQLLILSISAVIGTYAFWRVEWNEFERIAKEKVRINN